MSRSAAPNKGVAQNDARVLGRIDAAAVVAAAKYRVRLDGHRKMTVADVGVALGVSHTNVYRFFASRNDLIDGVLESCLSDNYAALAKVEKAQYPIERRVARLLLSVRSQLVNFRNSDPNLYALVRERFYFGGPAIDRHLLRVTDLLQSMLLGMGQIDESQARNTAVTALYAAAKLWHPVLFSADRNGEVRFGRLIRFVSNGFAIDARRACSPAEENQTCR